MSGPCVILVFGFAKPEPISYPIYPLISATHDEIWPLLFNIQQIQPVVVYIVIQ